MKRFDVVFFFSFLLLSSAAQENRIPDVAFGVRGDVNAFPYTYSLKGTALLDQKHALSLGPLMILPTNPFKEKIAFGSCLNYDYYFGNLGTHRFNFLLQTNVQYSRQYHEVKFGPKNGQNKFTYFETWMFNTVGLGLNARLSHYLFLQATTSFMICYYHDDPSVIFWTDGPHKNPVMALSKTWVPAQLNLALTFYFPKN